MIADGMNIQYLRTLVRGEALRQLDTLYIEVGSTISEHLKLIILSLATYFHSVKALSKQKRVIRLAARKTCGLELIRYVARMIDLNKYSAVFTGENPKNTNCKMELNVFVTARQTAGSGKNMCRGLIVNSFFFKIL